MRIEQEKTGCTIDGEFTIEELKRFEKAGWHEVEE